MHTVLDKYQKRTLSVDAFCDLYSVGRTLAYNEMAAGRLRSFTIGRKRLIPAEAAETWLAGYAAHLSPIAA